MMGTASGLEEAYHQAQDMINQVSRRWKDGQLEKPSLGQKNLQHSKKSIHSRLTRLYFEELSKVPHATPDSVLNNLENECDLLGRLVQREGLHTLIVNLYAGNKGYSLAVRNNDKTSQFDKSLLAETPLMGYEQGELLSSIDNGQLPPTLAEQLDPAHSHLFYDGCVIAEVRDYRKSLFHTKPDVHHVLLKPTTQSILSDVSALTNDGDWSHEERLLLESRLIEATQGPLCLDPNPIPSLAASKSRALPTDNHLQRQAKKFSQVTLNRKRKLEQLAQPEGLTIHDLMQRIRAKRSGTTINTACPPPPPSNPPPPLLPPTSPIDVLSYAKAYERPRETKDCLPQLIEEYILETDRGQGRVYHIKLSVLQRPSNSEYLGELYVDRDYREGEKNGSACRFVLGTRVQVNQYMQQFTEIFTEEGRKNVTIKHIVPGQPPRVTCTPGMQRAHQQAQQLAQQLQQAQSQHVAQQILSRAQGQLNNLAGQVAIKAISEATTSAQTSQNIQTLHPTECANASRSPGQPLTNGTAVVAPILEAPSLIDANTANNVNGSPGILVFQQKPQPIVNHSVGTNVPVLQAQLQAPSQPPATVDANVSSQQDVGFKKHSTNPAISALVTSLMNSAQQFQQQAAANAAAAALNNVQQQHQQQTVKANSNAAILSLLNSSPANLNQQKAQTRRISLNTSLPSRVIGHGNVITVPHTSGQVRVSFSSALPSQLAGKQQPVKATAVRFRMQDNSSNLGLSMPGLSALLAGTPSADNPIPGINSASSLLERLTASSSQASQPASPLTNSTPTGNVSLQGVNLTSLPASINGLQNVQVSFPGLSQSITMPLTVSAATASVTPTGVIVSLPISTGTNICSTVSSVSGLRGCVQKKLDTHDYDYDFPRGMQMVAATVVTTTVAGSTPTVVIANPANTHLSLPIAQIIPSGVKGLSQQSIRNTNTVALSQGGQAIQLVGSQRPRLNPLTRQVQPSQMKSAVLPNQLVTVSKTANQLILSGNKQVLTPIMANKPVLMTSQATPSSQAVPANKHTLLTKSLHARTSSSGQVNSQSQGIGVASLSQQQFQQLQQCLAAQHKAAVAAGNSPNRTQIQARSSTTSAPGDESL